MVNPLPAEQFLGSVEMAGQQIDGPQGKFTCVRLTLMQAPNPSPQAYPLARYCFDEDKTTLRFQLVPETAQGALLLRVKLTSFEGRWLPADLQIFHNGKPVLTAHLESVEAATKLDAGLLQPPPGTALYPTTMVASRFLPPDRLAASGESPAQTPTSGQAGGDITAKPGRMTLMIPYSEAKEMLLESPSPVYPPIAKAARVSGVVVLKGLIAADGTVKSLEAVSGPAMLQGAAIEAVKKWRYKPYLVAGQPVEIETTINVVFLLDR